MQKSECTGDKNKKVNLLDGYPGKSSTPFYYTILHVI
jgi:hypothetical protein